MNKISEMTRPELITLVRRVYKQFLIPAFLLVIVGNIVVTTLVMPARLRPLRTFEAGDFHTLVDADEWAVGAKFGVYEDLRAIAAGTLIAPPDSFVDGRVARDMARVEVDFRDYDFALPENHPLTMAPHVAGGTVLVGEDNDRHGYSILDGPPTDTYWLALAASGRFLIVPTSVAPAPLGGRDG